MSYFVIDNGWVEMLTGSFQEVMVRPARQKSQRCQYFKVMDPATPICLAPCGHFYEEDEYEMHLLQNGSVPFCGTQQDIRQQI